jgi:ABC-type multidrug transport system ATPase subunit
MSDPLPAAIHARGLNLTVRARGRDRRLLEDIDLTIPQAHFVAVIGASGCGKSTLIKCLSGQITKAAGDIRLAGHPVLQLKEQYPLAIGYLPQFAAFHEKLTVREILHNAAALRLPATVTPETRASWLGHIIDLSRIGPLLDQRYETLSGGQMRRVALAEELIGDPPFLFLDEVTSGLDPHSDQEMMTWLRELAHGYGKTIMLVTHSPAYLGLCDSLIFLDRGRMIYHGPLDALFGAMGIEAIEQLYARYQEEFVHDPVVIPAAEVPVEEHPAPQSIRTAKPPGPVSQLGTLIRRQFGLFLRDRGQVVLHLILLFSFPALVAVFATSGLPQVRNLSLSIDTNFIQSLVEQLQYLKESFEAASLVAGLAMFQVILLTLMGANNGAREIANERPVLDKELRAGLSPGAYLLSKLLFVLVLSTAQAVWMSWFVKNVCGFPGEYFGQLGILFLATIAMSTTCLAISAASPSPERASLLAIYLVGLQLPLSGAVLAMPEWLTWLSRPFIAAYWGWCGYLKTLETFRIYDVVRQARDTYVAGYAISAAVLAFHVLACTLFAWRKLPREMK